MFYECQSEETRASGAQCTDGTITLLAGRQGDTLSIDRYLRPHVVAQNWVLNTCNERQASNPGRNTLP